jgi:hypothetical protein
VDTLLIVAIVVVAVIVIGLVALAAIVSRKGRTSRLRAGFGPDRALRQAAVAAAEVELEARRKRVERLFEGNIAGPRRSTLSDGE